jgi:hypothetical protein
MLRKLLKLVAIAFGVVILLVVGMVGYVLVVDPPASTQRHSAQASTSTASAPRRLASNERFVTAVEYGPRWPLTVDTGVLSCIDGSVVTFEHAGSQYALNGRAIGMAKQRGYQAPEAIWRSQPVVAPKAVVERLPEPQRRNVFAAGVACEDKFERGDQRVECQQLAYKTHGGN